MYVHPKTGPGGSENITDEAKKHFYKKVTTCLVTDEGLYELNPAADRQKLLFTAKKKS